MIMKVKIIHQYRDRPLDLSINDFIKDKEVIDIMTKDFLEDMKNSEELKLEEFNNRSMIKKVKESIPPLQSGIDSLFVLIYISVSRHTRCGALRAPCGCRAHRGTRRRDA